MEVGWGCVQAMMKDQFANYVVQKVLETCDESQRELLLGRIRVHLHALKKYTYGKHIVARVEKLVAAGGEWKWEVAVVGGCGVWVLGHGCGWVGRRCGIVTVVGCCVCRETECCVHGTQLGELSVRWGRGRCWES